MNYYRTQRMARGAAHPYFTGPTSMQAAGRDLYTLPSAPLTNIHAKRVPRRRGSE